LRRLLLVLFVFAWPAARAATEAESHILSAFTSGADPGILARDVRLGPRLRAELGRADSAKVYDALVDRVTGNLIRVNPLGSEEAARHAALVGSASDLLTLESGGVVLLMQYAPARRQVSFVEQIGVAPPPLKPAPEPTQVEAPQLAPQPPKAAPVVEKPLAVVPPPMVEKPKPVAPKAVEKPRAPAPVAAQPEKPRGECVIKPVMSDEDLYNCGARTGR
jgi:hypothetical protein